MRTGRITSLILVLWLWSLHRVGAQPTDVVVLTDADQPHAPLPTNGALSAYVDSSQTQSWQTVQGQAFVPVGHMVPNVGYTATKHHVYPFWIRFRLQNATRHTIRLYARANFWCFDSLQFFVVDPARDSLVATSPVWGWQQPSEPRLLADRAYSYLIVAPPGIDQMVYLRVVKKRGTQVVPLALWRETGYATALLREHFFWGGVLLSLLFVAAMSLFFFLTTRDSIYWSYLLSVLCLIGFFVINDGFLHLFAFRAQFWLPRQNVYFLFPLLLFYSQLIFVRTFLPLKRTSARWLHQLSTAGLVVGLLCVLMLAGERWVTYSPGLEKAFTRVFTAVYWLPMPLIGAFVMVSIRRGYYVAAGWLYLVAVTPFYVLNFGQVLAHFSLIPTYEPVVDFRYYALAALFEVLALTFGLAYRYKLMRDRNDKLLRSQREQERTTYVSEVQSLALRNSMLEEKERIARDLHDNVGAQLALMITSLLHISRQAEHVLVPNGKPPGNHVPRLADELRLIVGNAREAIRTLRETIWAINQESFTLTEFEERLNQYVNRYVQQTNGLEVDVRIEGATGESLSSVEVLNFFRIVQEALSNVVKHAGATHATVVLLMQPDGAFHLTIHDNGRGLDTGPDQRDDRHYGIHNMKRRAEELGGRFQIYEAAGTVVDVVREGVRQTD